MRPRLAPIAASRFEFVAALPADEIVTVGTADAPELAVVEEREVEGERKEWTPVLMPVPTGIETAGIETAGIETAGIEIVGKEIAGIEIAGIDGIETEKNGIRTLSNDSGDDPAPLPLSAVRGGPEGCMDLIDAERGLEYNLF
jgi:hypothetical protein